MHAGANSYRNADSKNLLVFRGERLILLKRRWCGRQIAEEVERLSQDCSEVNGDNFNCRKGKVNAPISWTGIDR